MTKFNLKEIYTDFSDNGYAIFPEVKMEEEKWLYDFVEHIWLEIIKINYPSILAEAKLFGLSNYNKISDKLDHSKLWNKNNRIFTKEQVQELVSNLSIFKNLKILYNDYTIMDIEKIGYPEIYWRLVRPNSINDVAVAHKDSWFFSSTNNLSIKEQIGIAKVWLPVSVNDNLSGLSVSPQSHLIEIPHTIEFRHGRLKPTANKEVLDSFPLKSLKLRPGQAVVFDRDLLHKGIAHNGENTRVSIEFAIHSFQIS